MDTQHVTDAVRQACETLTHLKRQYASQPEITRVCEREIRKWRRLGAPAAAEHSGGQPELFHTQKQKQAYAMQVEQVVELTSPYIMFAKMSSPTWLANKYIYWYAYSLGKVRNIMYGIAVRRAPEHGWNFKIKFACSFNSLVTLNQVMDHLKAKDYGYVAALAKDNINPTIMKYTGEQREYDVNRSDVPREKQHYAEFAGSFKKYLEHLRYAATPVTGTCIRYEQFIDVCKGSCRMNKTCRQFDWGEPGCRVKADRGSATGSLSVSKRKASRTSESEDEDIL